MTPTASSVPTPVTTSIGDSADGDGEAERAAELEQRAAAAEADMQRLLQQEIQALAQRDREVRAHEQAHLAVGGQYAGPVSYDYQRGPDGRLYAVGGSVAIDVAPIPDDPEATLQKMQQVQRAALAPAEPSAQDLAVAAQASQQAAAARAELAQDNLAEEEDEVASSSSPLRNLIDSVEDERSVEIAVTAQAPDSDVDPSLRNRAAMASYQSTEQNANLSALLDLRA
ncbi:MAG: hypothetical protein EA348_08970 [Pseudomonadaceae bacterium]|nr:MAG: hypothetical protein EA348_08970 [Pseudomonadaceae bacterium]